MLSFEIGRMTSRADIKEPAGVGRDSNGGRGDTGIVKHDGGSWSSQTLVQRGERVTITIISGKGNSSVSPSLASATGCER